MYTLHKLLKLNLTDSEAIYYFIILEDFYFATRIECGCMFALDRVGVVFLFRLVWNLSIAVHVHVQTSRLSIQSSRPRVYAYVL